MKLCKDCRNQGKKKKCQFYNPMSNYAEKCPHFKKIKQTNADRIRSMSDEELAVIIMCPYDTAESGLDQMPCAKDGIQKMVTVEECRKCSIAWLQSEVEE